MKRNHIACLSFSFQNNEYFLFLVEEKFIVNNKRMISPEYFITCFENYYHRVKFLNPDGSPIDI